MCGIGDRLCRCGGVLQLWPGSLNVENCDEKRVPRRIHFEAKCRETTRH